MLVFVILIKPMLAMVNKEILQLQVLVAKCKWRKGEKGFNELYQVVVIQRQEKSFEGSLFPNVLGSRKKEPSLVHV